MSHYLKLSHRQRQFVDGYVQTGIGSEAMRLAGFKGSRPEIAACKLKALPEIQAAIAERTEEAIVAAGVRTVRVLEEVARIALFDPLRLKDENGRGRQLKDMPADVRSALVSAKFAEDGSLVSFRAHPKVESLKLLMQHLKILVEHHEHTGKDGAALIPTGHSDLEIARRIAFLLDAGIRAVPASVLDQESVPESGKS